MTRSLSIRLVGASVTLVAMLGCASTKAPPNALAAEVDAASGGAAWRSRHALAANITVSRPGRPDLHGRMLYETRDNRLVLQFQAQGGGFASGGLDSRSLWLDCPLDADYADWPRILQWASWVAVPYRLTDPSLRARTMQPVSIGGTAYGIVELERPADGRGRCALYVEPGDFRLRGVVPIRPTGLAPAEMPAAYAFAYEAFDFCDDVLVPARWSVWPWDAGGGVSPAGPVASITLQDLRFVDADPSLFDPPTGDATKRLPRPVSPVSRMQFEEVSNDTP